MIVTKHKIVSIHYTLKDASGQVLQQNTDHDPEDYLHGAGQLLPALERALEGMQLKQTRQVILAPEEAYGLVNHDLIIKQPIADHEEEEIVEGQLILLADGSEAVVIEKMNGYFTADANHPLSGQTLYYSIQIAGIRDATEAEIRNGAPLRVPPGCDGSVGCC